MNKLQKVSSPILHLQAKSEWMDDTLKGYQIVMKGSSSKDIKKDQRFVLGSHDHGGAVCNPTAKNNVGKMIRAYLHKYLKSPDICLDEWAPVQYYIQNANEWRKSQKWPIHNKVVHFYMNRGEGNLHTLSKSPVENETILSYEFDPDRDNVFQNKVESLNFYSQKLESTMTIGGTIKAEFYVSIDTPDTDIFVTLYEIFPSQKTNLIRSGSLRLRFRKSFASPKDFKPGEIEKITILFPAVVYKISAGSQLGMQVKSTEYAYFENSNMGIKSDIRKETKTQKVKVRIFNGPVRKSSIILPVIEDK